MHDLIAVGQVAQWEKLKTLVLDSVSSPITKRVYNMALDEFMAWFQQAPRPGFTKVAVSAWRVSLEERRLGSSSIIIRMSAIRKLGAEAADNGLLAPELAQGISRVKGAQKQVERALAIDERACGPKHPSWQSPSAAWARSSPRGSGGSAEADRTRIEDL
jgi:site-specific recombinase XerC